MFRVFRVGLINLLRFPIFPIWLLLRLALKYARRPSRVWLRLKLQPDLVEFQDPKKQLLYRFAPQLAEKQPTSLSFVRALVEEAKDDPRVQGLVVEIPMLRAGFAKLRGLHAALRELNAVKPVIAYLPDGGTHREAYIASSARHVMITPRATMATLGLGSSGQFLKGLLDKLGIEVQVFAKGRYKTAAENLVRSDMSEAQKEQLGELLERFDGELRAALATRVKDVDQLFANAFWRGADALEIGLADSLGYEDELAARMGELGGTGPVPQKEIAPALPYLAMRKARFFKQLLPRERIGVVSLRGAIGKPEQTAQTIAALRLAARDKHIKAVVFDIDSPGGSAIASDRIHREVERLAAKKPVVAAFGNVAASGGYYVAAPATKIIAEPTTVTGSIGVVATRLVFKDLLERNGVTSDPLRIAPHADLFSPTRPMNAEECALFEKELDGFYDGFLDIVAAGRGRPREEVEGWAGGRIYAGTHALELGLVDALGGLGDAIGEARALTNLPARRAKELGVSLVIPRRSDVPPISDDTSAPAAFLAPLLRPILGPVVAPLITLAGLIPDDPRTSAALETVAALRGEQPQFLAMDVPEIR